MEGVEFGNPKWTGLALALAWRSVKVKANRSLFLDRVRVKAGVKFLCIKQQYNL